MLARSSLAAAAGLLLSFSSVVQGAFDLGFQADDDLFHFVTRPELKPPKFEVKKYFPDEITPGYWFVAPYANIIQEPFARLYYQPCQTGPAIYDQDGELIWSGACAVRNQNMCDFRVFEANGSSYLSGILTINRQADPVGRAVIFNESLQLQSIHQTPDTLVPYNMHEFNVIENGSKGMHIIQKTEIADTSMVRDTNLTAGLAINMGIREFELATGKTTFEWWVHWDVDHGHSNFASGNKLRGPFPDGWDWVHLNAIDKSEDGDYLVTARYTDAIYKVSGKDKKLIWKLGGIESDFVLNGFQISGPHDGRFYKLDDGLIFNREPGKEYVSFLDNGGDETRKLANISTAYILELDKTKKPWTANVIKKWTRPDGGRSDKRGNFQLLDNGNAFVGWSDNCYMSEHSPDGRTLMEARFASKRFVSYRSYLFNYTTDPVELPVVKGFAYGEDPEHSVSVYYASWNGATDVASWRFVNAETDELLGAKDKKSFETSYTQSRTLANYIYVEAVLKNGTVVEWSDPVAVQRPAEWPPAPEPTATANKPVIKNDGTVDDSAKKGEAGVSGQGMPAVVKDEL